MSMAAGLTENRTLLAKADLALSDLTASGGLLQPAQAQKFIRVLIDQSVLLPMATVVPMKAQIQLVEKIRFAGRVLHAGSEATALPVAARAKPTLGKVQLTAQLFKGEIRLDNEVLEDNIERGQLRNTIMQMMAEAISRDLDEVIIKGDTASTDPFLAKIDGVLKQATSNVVDAQLQTTNKSIFRDMLKTMPTPFLRNKKALKFFTSTDSEIDYRDSISDRTGILADKVLTEDEHVGYSGVEVIPVPLFPENLGVGSNCTNMLLVDPKNINVGIWREIRIETDKLVSEGVLIVVATLRMDTKFAEETACVKATNVKVS